MTDSNSKPHSPSCERNQEFILNVLKEIIKTTDKHLLEIGSGTGQHAVYMSHWFPKLQWHTSDVMGKHEGIIQWIQDSNSENISEPIFYQSGMTKFPDIQLDIVYTANTLHIMSWKNVKNLIYQFGKNLKQGAQIVIYGPFNYNCQFTSESNAKFDIWLKDQCPNSGIRNFESVVELMNRQSISLLEDLQMPSYNRILHFQKD